MKRSNWDDDLCAHLRIGSSFVLRHRMANTHYSQPGDCCSNSLPSYRLSSYGRRAFSVAGPTTWNSLPRHLRDPVHTTSVFARLLRRFSVQSTSVHSALGLFLALMRYINSRFTYLPVSCIRISRHDCLCMALTRTFRANEPNGLAAFGRMRSNSKAQGSIFGTITLCRTIPLTAKVKVKVNIFYSAPNRLSHRRGAQVHGAHQAASHIPALNLPSRSR